MYAKLVEFLGFLPSGWENIAAIVVIAVIAIMVLRIAFKLALRLVAQTVRSADQAHRMALMITAFTGGGIAIPLTFEGFLGLISKMF